MHPRLTFPKPNDTVVAQAEGLGNRITLKFAEGSRVRLQNGKLTTNSGDRSQQEQRLLSRNNLTPSQVSGDLVAINGYLANRELVLERMFTRPEADLDKEKLAAEHQRDRELADLNLYYFVVVSTDAKLVAQTIGDLNKFQSVEIAYLQPVAAPAVDLAPPTADLSTSQGYLNASPNGIDAVYAWNFPGGRGDHVRIVDVEGNWHTDHEDFPDLFWAGTGFANALDSEHGTEVVGVLAAGNNAYGVTGIVSEAQIGLSTTWWAVGLFDANVAVANAINEATARLRRGDLLLIEVHMPGPDSDPGAPIFSSNRHGFLPVEYFLAEFDAISRATSLGIIVVEAAGNGEADLDETRYASRINHSSRDSGAIIVGAGTSNGGRVPHLFTNHGSRVDLHGWGDSVTTLGRGADGLRFNGDDRRQWYTNAFAGTSSASAIVAGAAAAVQSIYQAIGRTPLGSWEMRDLLRQTGAPQATHTWQIGPLPNLNAALAALGLYWSAATGAHWVHGAIFGLYLHLGGPGGFLGYPSTDETSTPDGVGRYNHFQGGSVYWTPGTGAHEVHGAIRDLWAALGWEQGFLGYPLTDETITPDGVGRYNHFQGGSIYWTPDTGAHEVHGGIRDLWAHLGWEQGFLGYPLTDETIIPGGGHYNHFQGGSIYWTRGTGAHEVHGAIRDLWVARGAERSRLGYPTSDQYNTGEGPRGDFEHGWVIITRTGAREFLR